MIRGTLAACAAALLVLAGSASAAGKSAYPVAYHAFELGSGTTSGTQLDKNGALVLAKTGLTTVSYADPFGYPTRDYLAGTWTSVWQPAGFPFLELVSSWNADTPAGTWIQVEMRATAADDGHLTKWYVMGRWAYGDGDIHRTSVGGQGDKDGYVAIDTFVPKRPMSSYQLQLTLYRAAGSSATPKVSRIGAVVSDPVTVKPYVPSTTTMTQSVELPVPRYSQELHRGEYPQFDNGGEAWCSPTSTSMVVAYWNRGPAPADYAYVLNDYPATTDPQVDYAARYVFDYHYNGAGNWPFNAAYAAHFGLESEVTQLHSLAEAEQFVKAGIPLVISIAFNSGKLDGFFFKSTNGHLMVLVGFTADGNPIVNDPASPDDASVRHVYDRAQFEDAWMSATGGIVYVIHPPSVPLPQSSGGNW
ncbi:MAG: peptidase C39 family protein [Actinobacteria bacterium]|nr:MAG: peptidase C39 family protein [Actinomycetota bacterium]